MPAGNSQDNENAVMHVTTIQKQVTITNSSTQYTMYPVFEANNNPANQGKPYDPYDPASKEYRAYVGYTQGGKNWVGLLPGHSITFDIPQALWDGGRIYFVTDNPVTEQSFYSNGDPFNFDPAAKTYVKPVANGGVLLLYRAQDPKAIAGASASQIAEYTIRDKSTTPNIPNSVDLDVQYIDYMFLPVAMEAVLPGKNNPLAGYVGTTNSVANFEKTLQQFVQGTQLSGYFNGRGWPQVNLTASGVDPSALIKIPGGDNLFQNSVSVTPYNPFLPLLTSSQSNQNVARNSE